MQWRLLQKLLVYMCLSIVCKRYDSVSLRIVTFFTPIYRGCYSLARCYQMLPFTCQYCRSLKHSSGSTRSVKPASEFNAGNLPTLNDRLEQVTPFRNQIISFDAAIDRSEIQRVQITRQNYVEVNDKAINELNDSIINWISCVECYRHALLRYLRILLISVFTYSSRKYFSQNGFLQFPFLLHKQQETRARNV